MHRYVKRGSKGIALIDNSGDYPRLRYVFDVLDTGTRANSRELNSWQMLPEHEYEFADIVEGSRLEEYDDDNRRMSFLNALSR